MIIPRTSPAKISSVTPPMMKAQALILRDVLIEVVTPPAIWTVAMSPIAPTTRQALTEIRKRLQSRYRCRKEPCYS
jgi:hypothetical protein